MNNNIRIHTYNACEEQPEDFPCICDHLAAQEYDAMVDAQIRDALEK